MEKVLEVVAVRTEGAKSPETVSVVTVEMRNGSAKTITAYLLTFTVTRGGTTDHFGALGKDLVYDLMLARHARRAAPGTSFLPSQVSPAVRKFLTDRIAVLRALRETLSELSGVSESK